MRSMSARQLAAWVKCDYYGLLCPLFLMKRDHRSFGSA